MLFFGSYYFDTLQAPLRPRRLSIGAPIIRSKEYVYLSTYEDETTGVKRTNRLHEFPGQQAFQVDSKRIELMQDLRLDRINALIQESSSVSANDVSRRLKLAITWFGKACNSNTVAESYISNAIAIEALLSQGRTHQSTYSKEIGYLVIHKDDQGLYPLMQPISREFSRNYLRL